ncbi:pyridoxal phosphate-dependent aminotransferase, partial [candidate division KSB1 bacterium]|nr:pyridoxal phosphate-dependent aminotransferase [candidate division KSB1 bacterium]
PEATSENIIMTSGAACGLNIILKAILNPGDEVIILAPYFVEYLHYVTGHGGSVVIVNTKADFHLDLAAIASKMTPRTKAIIINSPNNPSGRIYPQADLEQLVDLLNQQQRRFKTEIALISDEPYRELAFDGQKVPSVAAFYDNSFIVYSWSKSLSIPGDRIGYVAFNPRFHTPRILDALSFCLRLLGFVNAPATMQWVVNKLIGVSVDVGHYENQRNRIYASLRAAGYDVIKPDGAFYMFPRAPNNDSLAFMQQALAAHILVVPGQGFGWPSHFRLAYCTDDQTIDRALTGLAQLLHHA